MKTAAKYLAVSAFVVALSSCAPLTLEHVDFSWPVESVLSVSNNNTIDEGRYGLALRVGALAGEEFQDSTALRGAKLRMLRSTDGFYFVTGPKFKNVYVFAPGAGELRLDNKISVSQKGMNDPALNQRAPYVELIDGDAHKVLLTRDGIEEGKK